MPLVRISDEAADQVVVASLEDTAHRLRAVSELLKSRKRLNAVEKKDLLDTENNLQAVEHVLVYYRGECLT